MSGTCCGYKYIHQQTCMRVHAHTQYGKHLSPCFSLITLVKVTVVCVTTLEAPLITVGYYLLYAASTHNDLLSLQYSLIVCMCKRGMSKLSSFSAKYISHHFHSRSNTFSEILLGRIQGEKDRDSTKPTFAE